MLKSATQDGLVVVFPGSANFHNYVNALQISTVPWQNFLDWQLQEKLITPTQYKKKKLSLNAKHRLGRKKYVSETGPPKMAFHQEKHSVKRSGTVGTAKELFSRTHQQHVGRATSLHGLGSIRFRQNSHVGCDIFCKLSDPLLILYRDH